MCYQMVLAGLGRHIVDLPIEARVETFKNLYIAEQLYVASTTFVKVAYGCKKYLSHPATLVLT